MQIRLIAKQAPRVVWAHNFQNSVVLISVLQSYCTDYGLDAQHATISSNQGGAVSLDEVVSNSRILFIYFQPTLCFYIWHCLFVSVPKPSNTSWVDAYSVEDAAQFAVECASPLADTELLTMLKAVRPEQLVPYSCLPTTDSSTHQPSDEEQPIMRMCRAFLAGLLQPADRQTVPKSKVCIFPSTGPALRAIALVQQLLWLIQPLAPLQGRDSVLVQVIDFLTISIPSLHVDDPTAAVVLSEPYKLPGSNSIADTDQLFEAVMQTSVQLLQAKLHSGTPDYCPYALVSLKSSTVHVLGSALQHIKAGSALADFCRRGGLELLVRLLGETTPRSNIAAILQTIWTTLEDKEQLTRMWHALLDLGVLPLLAANLRPFYATGEETEAETGQRAFGKSDHPLLHAPNTSQHKHIHMIARLMLTFVKLQKNQQQRTSTYSLSVVQSVGAQMLTKQHAEYKSQLGLAASDSISPGLSKQMEDLRMLACAMTSSNSELPLNANAVGLICAETCQSQLLLPDMMDGAVTDAQPAAEAPTPQPTSSKIINAPAAVLTPTAPHLGQHTAAKQRPPSQCACADTLPVSDGQHDIDDLVPSATQAATSQVTMHPGNAICMLETTAAPNSPILPSTQSCIAAASASASESTSASVVPLSSGQATTSQAEDPSATQSILTAGATPSNTAAATSMDLLITQDRAVASPNATHVAAVNDAEPNSVHELVAAASQARMTAADNSVQPAVGKQTAETASVPIVGAQLEAFLAEMVNCGVHSIGKHHLYQQHWPTPDAAVWDQTVKLAAQVAAVQEWLLSKGQRQQLHLSVATGIDDEVPEFARGYAELQHSLLVLLHMLVYGHIPDMSLDMMPLFENIFAAVTHLWSTAEICYKLADSPVGAHTSADTDTSCASQLGRAMLHRLVSDRELALGVVKWGSLGEPWAWADKNLTQALNSLFSLASTYQQASEELGCGVVATHPDWHPLLVALYDLITHLDPSCLKSYQHTTMTPQLGQLLPQLEPNTAAQATAAACVCCMHATLIKLEENPAKKLRLCTAAVRSDALAEVWSVLIRTLLAYTDPSLGPVEGSLPAARLFAQFTALYQLLPEALQKELEGLPVCLRPWQEASAAEVEVVACAIDKGHGIVQCMRTCAAAKQTARHDYKSNGAAIARRHLITAALHCLAVVVNAYYRGVQWPMARYQLITDAAVQLVHALCPAAMLPPADANSEYLACFNENNAVSMFSLLIRSWLDSASVASPTQISTPTISLPREPMVLVLTLLEYMQASIMAPQVASQKQMLAFGGTLCVTCLQRLEQEADRVVAMSEEEKLHYLKAEPKLSPLAVCLEGLDMYFRPGQGFKDDSNMLLTAMQSCASYTLVLLGLVTYIHGQFTIMSREALLAHKQGIYLARDPSLEDNAQHDRLVDEAQAKKEDAQQERQELESTARIANVELDKMIGVCTSLYHKQKCWGKLLMWARIKGQFIKNMIANAIARSAISQTQADAILTAFFADLEGSSLQQVEASQQALLAEEEQAKVKAAAKKAKKQRQKAKKSQQTSPVTSAHPAMEPNPASTAIPSSSPKHASELDPISPSHHAVSSKSASTRQPNAVRDPGHQSTAAGVPASPAAIPCGLAPASAGIGQLQQELQHLQTDGSDDRQDDQFLEELFCCPLSRVLMVDPVIAADGHTYERAAIQRWLQTQSRSPVTSLPLSHTRLTPNLLVKSAIQTQMTD